jgi:hypothetical protein
VCDAPAWTLSTRNPRISLSNRRGFPGSCGGQAPPFQTRGGGAALLTFRPRRQAHADSIGLRRMATWSHSSRALGAGEPVPSGLLDPWLVGGPVGRGGTTGGPGTVAVTGRGRPVGGGSGAVR